jgi:hypothetical protein
MSAVSVIGQHYLPFLIERLIEGRPSLRGLLLSSTALIQVRRWN